MNPLAQLMTKLGVWTASPAASLLILAYLGGWLYFEPHTLDWHGIATLVTWFMTLLIQRAEHRDTQAIHGKLDELLRAHRGADDDVTRLDEREPEEIEEQRRRKQQD